MTFYHRSSDRKRIFHDYPGEEEEDADSFCQSDGGPINAKNLHEHEKRIRREIANSNERRRMQNINAGLQSLKALIPHTEGEKLSKVAILQSAAEYVYQLEQDKTRLLEQNDRMSRIMNSPNHSSYSPVSKRKRIKTDSADEGIGSSSSSRSDNDSDDLKQEIRDLRLELEHERALRLLLEEQIRDLECRLSQLKKESTSSVLKVKPSLLAMNLCNESGLGSPQSQISSQDTESAHEMSLRGSSPEPSNLENCQNNCPILLPRAEQSISDTANIPGLLMPTSPSSFPVESGISQQVVPTGNRCRQNLDAIVEAIKHVEGLGVFQSDPKSEVE